jgi:hypothetical protein
MVGGTMDLRPAMPQGRYQEDILALVMPQSAAAI